MSRCRVVFVRIQCPLSLEWWRQENAEYIPELLQLREKEKGCSSTSSDIATSISVPRARFKLQSILGHRRAAFFSPCVAVVFVVELYSTRPLSCRSPRKGKMKLSLHFSREGWACKFAVVHRYSSLIDTFLQSMGGFIKGLVVYGFPTFFI